MAEIKTKQVVSVYLIATPFILALYGPCVYVSNRLEPGNFFTYLQTPGGKVDKTDASVAHAAMRETEEETGLALSLDRFISMDPLTYRRSDAAQTIVCAFYVVLRPDEYPRQTEPDKATDWVLKPLKAFKFLDPHLCLPGLIVNGETLCHRVYAKTVPGL